MRILLSAYSCNPNKGSEPGVGWNWLHELAKYNEVWVLFYTGQEQYESVSLGVYNLTQKENIHLIPIDVPFPFGIKKLFRFRYEVWQIKAYFAAKKIIKENQIDLIHQVTIAAWWFSGYYYKLKIPFLIGPILGGQKTNTKFFHFVQYKTKLYEYARNISIGLLSKIYPKAKYSFKKAAIVFAGNKETSLFLNGYFNLDSKLFLTTGVETLPTIADKRINNNQIEFLVTGLLIPCKNLFFLFEVLSQIPQKVKWRLRVVGEGPLGKVFKKAVIKNKLEKKIEFVGYVPKNKIDKYYKESDIFLFPSFREGAPTVILEAMTFALPTIAFKQNGADIMLDSSCGILIDITNPQRMVNDFANAIITLYENPQLRIEMGNNARKKVEENFLWEKRGKEMQKYYEAII